MSLISIARLSGILGSRLSRQRPNSTAIIAIREIAAKLRRLSDRQLAEDVSQLRAQSLLATRTYGEIVSATFALVVEAVRRTLGFVLYDVQLLGGLALTRRCIAEIQTGEGKTLVTLLPACFHALVGEGVHVMTVNDYLAHRDYRLLAPAYRLLGLSVGLVQTDASWEAKHAAYACDVTYSPSYQFGFDFLRDQVARLPDTKPRLGELLRDRQRGLAPQKIKALQRGHHVAIIDEADSVLIDEATTPLVLSDSPESPTAHPDVYRSAARLAASMKLDQHFVLDGFRGTIQMTELGVAAMRAHAPPNRIVLQRAWSDYVEKALHALHLYHPDVDYVVDRGRIQLVDSHTGRIFDNRTWRDGLHQAIQAKEQVEITAETRSQARISRQRYFQLYRTLCGMTGTAQGSEAELRAIYRLDLCVIPPNKPCLREQLPMRAFGSQSAKESAIVDEVTRIHHGHRPVLVGTTSIEASERLSRRLNAARISHQLLNGKQDAAEAEIIARAGVANAVTIATNMAGRGTDIQLDTGVCRLGGLHVIAMEPHESCRVDRQLFGRAARQGDPGSCRLFASADDDLFSRYAPDLAKRLRRLARGDLEIRVELSRDVARIQRRVQSQLAAQRRQMFHHDHWMEKLMRDLGG